VSCAAAGEAGREEGGDGLATDCAAELALDGFAALAATDGATAKVGEEGFEA